MRYLVQRENAAFFAVILGPFADCASFLIRFRGGEARIAVTALLDQRGDMVFFVCNPVHGSIVILEQDGS
jgi:hypothetical protein